MYNFNCVYGDERCQGGSGWQVLISRRTDTSSKIETLCAEALLATHQLSPILRLQSNDPAGGVDFSESP